MSKYKVKISPLGDCALTIEFGNELSVRLNERVLQAVNFFEKNPFPGCEEIVPACSSLTIFYNVREVRKNFRDCPTAFEAVKNFAEKILTNSDVLRIEKTRLIKIPICFNTEFALDLEFVAAKNHLSPEKVIEIFLSRTYRVFMLGFLPGFSYMGELDKSIAAPRKQTPRTEVQKGSVGIAGRQTGIYSLAAPGGWQIIGKTDVVLFTPQAETPTFLQAGDTVEFYQVNL